MNNFHVREVVARNVEVDAVVAIPARKVGFDVAIEDVGGHEDAVTQIVVRCVVRDFTAELIYVDKDAFQEIVARGVVFDFAAEQEWAADRDTARRRAGIGDIA